MPPTPTPPSPAERAGRIWLTWLVANESQDVPRSIRPARGQGRVAWSLDLGLYGLALAAVHGDAPFRLSGRTAPTGGILPRYGHRYACVALGRMASPKLDARLVAGLIRLGALEELPDPAPPPARTEKARWARVAPSLVSAWLDAGVLAEPGDAGYLPRTRIETFNHYGEMPWLT